jgi:8-oxo-dGTP diphosphatase
MFPKVGVGVIVVKDGKILLGKRKGAHGSGSFAMPGGHLGFKETVENCAARELIEETGLTPLSMHLGPWTENVIDEDKHYITVFVIVTKFQGKLQLLEPHKCEGWDWYPWDDMPTPLFSTVASLLQSLGIEKLKEMTTSVPHM